MNNDIKEILDDLETEYPSLARNLRDYITNLQEEKDKYKRYVDDFLYTYEELQDKVIEKQQRIYKAIEYIEELFNTGNMYANKEELLDILRGE